LPVSVVQKQKLLWKFSYAFIFGAVFLFIIPLLLPINSPAQELPGLRKHIENGGYALSKNGKTLFSKNLKTNFIPASTIKLITSLAALQILGPDHHFNTHLYLDSSNTLYIKGSGDPFLVSEKIGKITELIAEQGITEIRDIVLDDSAFALEHETTDGSENSTKPYDVKCTSLGVNFNTLPLKVVHKGKVKSPESQTPYLPIMGRIGKDLTSGYHRVNVDAFPSEGMLTNSLLYSGQLFQTLLEQQGVSVTGKIRQGRVPKDTPQILNYYSEETISDLVQACLLSSNNFMANQLYLAVGVAQYGFPATWEKSQTAIADFIRNVLKLADTQVTMVEGSGLSKKNRISPEAMLVVLEQFRPYANLIPIKYGVQMKSGTLRKSGVFCYAGFINRGKTANPFVILLNQKKNGRDKILKLLYQQ
jgi:serine-type D-Ala-D-Ala carboxypeptidase/endopeptidase (penicillin-binding protein 4)